MQKKTITADKSLLLMNELMELVGHYSQTVGLSEVQSSRFKTLWNCLTDSGRDYVEIWAENNDFTVPSLTDLRL